MTLMIYRDYMHLATEIDRTVASASAVDKKRVLGNDNVLTESTEDLLGKMSSSTTSSSKSAHTLSTPVTNSKQDSVGSLTSNMDRLAVSENNSSSSSKRRSINAEVQSKVVSREVLTEFLGELYASILGGDKYGTDSNFVKMMRQLEMLPTNAVAIQSEIKQAW